MAGSWTNGNAIMFPLNFLSLILTMPEFTLCIFGCKLEQKLRIGVETKSRNDLAPVLPVSLWYAKQGGRENGQTHPEHFIPRRTQIKHQRIMEGTNVYQECHIGLTNLDCVQV